MDTLLNAVTESVKKLMVTQNFPLPENWTYSKIVEQVIHWGSGGSTLYEIFSDITEYGFASNYFHEALNILYSIGGPGVGG